MTRAAWLVLWWVATASAATYYIDDDGNNASDCATAAACGQTNNCKTHAALLTHVTLQSGDVVNWCDGLYRESITLTSGVTEQRATGAAVAILTAMERCTVWNPQGSGVFACTYVAAAGCTNAPQKLLVNGGPVVKQAATGCPASVATLANSKYCDNWPATACTSSADCANQPDGSSGACVNQAWCYNGSSVLLHLTNGLDPTSQDVEVGQRVNIINGGSKTDVTVDGLTVYGSDGVCNGSDLYPVDLQTVNGTNTLRNMHFELNGAGIQITGGTTHNLTGNTFEDCGIGWSYPPFKNSDGFHVCAVRSQSGTNVHFDRNTLSHLETHRWAHANGASLTNDCDENRAVCEAQSVAVQSPGQAGGVVTVDDNVATDIENGFDIEPAPGNILNAGSSMSRNVLIQTPHTAAHDSFSKQHSLGVRCASGGAGDVVCSTPYPVGGHIFHGMVINGNRVVGGRTGMKINCGNKQPADPYSCLVSNNMVLAGDLNQSSANTEDSALRVVDGSDALFRNNLWKAETNTPNQGGVALIDAHVTSNFQNNVFDGFGAGHGIIDNSGGTATFDLGTNVCTTGTEQLTPHCTIRTQASLAYVSASDLHVGPTSSLVNLCPVVAPVTADIDLQTRAGNTCGPDDPLGVGPAGTSIGRRVVRFH